MTDKKKPQIDKATAAKLLKALEESLKAIKEAEAVADELDKTK